MSPHWGPPYIRKPGGPNVAQNCGCCPEPPAPPPLDCSTMSDEFIGSDGDPVDSTKWDATAGVTIQSNMAELSVGSIMTQKLGEGDSAIFALQLATGDALKVTSSEKTYELRFTPATGTLIDDGATVNFPVTYDATGIRLTNQDALAPGASAPLAIQVLSGTDEFYFPGTGFDTLPDLIKFESLSGSPRIDRFSSDKTGWQNERDGGNIDDCYTYVAKVCSVCTGDETQLAPVSFTLNVTDINDNNCMECADLMGDYLLVPAAFNECVYEYRQRPGTGCYPYEILFSVDLSSVLPELFRVTAVLTEVVGQVPRQSDEFGVSLPIGEPERKPCDIVNLPLTNFVWQAGAFNSYCAWDFATFNLTANY